MQIVGKFWQNFENFDENSIEKLHVLIFILENLLLKIVFENTIFLQQFFRFGGGGFPLPPWLRPCWNGDMYAYFPVPLYVFPEINKKFYIYRAGICLNMGLA